MEAKTYTNHAAYERALEDYALFQVEEGVLGMGDAEMAAWEARYPAPVFVGVKPKLRSSFDPHMMHVRRGDYADTRS